MTGCDPKVLKEELARAEEDLVEVDAERTRIIQRISDLSARLSAIHQAVSTQQPKLRVNPPNRTAPSTSAQKVSLFMELFRGRTDVYPKRWINSKKNTKGYSPACANEWVRGVCDKPRIKCGECPNQAFIPVNEKTILDHLQGRHTIGVYPMTEDETCWFLAADFDKEHWREDVAAFAETCRRRGVPFAVERSRSGNGAHVWLFFTSPVPASTARRMGCFLITETMASRHELPMSSYDRFFPNQDTMPRGGFGNLITLPFQDGPRQQGNSVFVDETWTPYPDQWAFLASLGRMSLDEVEALAQEALESGQVIGVRMDGPTEDEQVARPWNRLPSRREPGPLITGPLPVCVQCVLAQLLFVETAGLPPPLINQIKRLAAFQNPEFYRKQATRLSTALTPRVISCAEDCKHHVGLPRGCVSDVEKLLKGLGIHLSIDDKRTSGETLDVSFRGELSLIQKQAVQTMAKHELGVFVAPPGSGKTVVAANLIARRRRSTLVLVHRSPLLEQWIAQLFVFLGRKPSTIGQIGGGKRKPNGSLDVAMIQSLARKDKVDDIVAAYGHVIVDECHHVPAVSFERIMREVKARYITGLTATPHRRDGLHPILMFQLGPTRFAIDAQTQAVNHSFDHKLIIRETEFRLTNDAADVEIQDIYRQLAMDEHRNRLILNDVIQALEERRSPILLTERRDHLEYFADHLRGLARNLIVLQGGMSTKHRREVIKQLRTIPETEERLVLATGRFIGEGFDDSRLDTLFLAMPVSWKGTLVQYAGRLHRQHHAKTEVRIMDYVDRSVPMLARMFEKRMRGYRAMGYIVCDYEVPEQVEDDYVIEYDQETIRNLETDS